MERTTGTKHVATPSVPLQERSYPLPYLLLLNTVKQKDLEHWHGIVVYFAENCGVPELSSSRATLEPMKVNSKSIAFRRR
jgi:hypothetical protein